MIKTDHPNVKSWEIVTGCERLSPGCDNCPTFWEYKAHGWDYHPRFNREKLREPYEILPPAIMIVAPGSDALHEAITYKQVLAMAAAMEHNPKIVFELGTKRVERLEALPIIWPDNVIVGVPVEEARYKWRIDALRNVQARTKMISFGPMTGRVGKIDMRGIDVAGVVVESWGKSPRSMKPEWVQEIKDQCIEQGVRYTEQNWISQKEVA